jgi:hypothetical protein
VRRDTVSSFLCARVILNLADVLIRPDASSLWHDFGRRVGGRLSMTGLGVKVCIGTESRSTVAYTRMVCNVAKSIMVSNLAVPSNDVSIVNFDEKCVRVASIMDSCSRACGFRTFHASNPGRRLLSPVRCKSSQGYGRADSLVSADYLVPVHGW